MTSSSLSFRWLDQRIDEIPDGPAGSMDTPPALIVWTFVGTVGVFVGLLPYVLIQFMSPQMWMVTFAKIGLWVSIVGYSPSFLRSAWLFAKSMGRWRSEYIEQMDHDLTCFRQLSKELRQFPSETVSEHLKFARDAQLRLSAKLAFFFGSFDKLGVLPALVAVGVQIKAYGDFSALPLWQVILALFLAVSYLVAATASLMRIRMQLYELVLADALGEKV